MQPTQNHLEQYFKYADALRNWLIVYGAGGIALLYTEEASFNRTSIYKIGVALFVAIFSQIAAALVNKWYNWIIHIGETNPHIGAQGWYNKLTSHLYVYLGINVAADIISLGAFMCATYFLLDALKIQIPSS